MEAEIISLFSGVGRQHGLEMENDLPLTVLQKQALNAIFKQESVTLANLRDSFVSVKNFVASCVAHCDF